MGLRDRVKIGRIWNIFGFTSTWKKEKLRITICILIYYNNDNDSNDSNKFRQYQKRFLRGIFGAY